MAKLFLPNSDHLKKAGFGSVAHAPVLFHHGYCREANRYLREFATGFDTFDHCLPCQKTLENNAHDIGKFFEWCEFKGLDWREVGYVDGVLAFQNDMHQGHWSPSSRSLAPETCNQRADTVTRFLSWAAKRSLRLEFKVKYRTSTRRSKAMRSTPGKAIVRMRPGRLKQSKTKEVEKIGYLPRPEDTTRWLAAVRQKKGTAKYLNARFLLESGARKEEGAAITEDQIPRKDRLLALMQAGQETAPISLVKTKGSRPRTISIPISFAFELRDWLDGKWLRLRMLYSKREGKAPPPQVFLSDAKGYEGTPIAGYTIYECFCSVSPRPARWSPHLARHAFVCFRLLFAMEYEAKALGSTLSLLGADWVFAKGLWHLKLLQKQLGHVDESTTELYLTWLSTAAGTVKAAQSWHHFLETELDGEK